MEDSYSVSGTPLQYIWNTIIVYVEDHYNVECHYNICRRPLQYNYVENHYNTCGIIMIYVADYFNMCGKPSQYYVEDHYIYMWRIYNRDAKPSMRNIYEWCQVHLLLDLIIYVEVHYNICTRLLYYICEGYLWDAKDDFTFITRPFIIYEGDI